jgi:hypothetical protein
MIVIHFTDLEVKKRALGYLMGRFSFTTSKTGEVLVPAPALGDLAAQGITFTVIGPATYEQSIPALRGPVATPI